MPRNFHEALIETEIVSNGILPSLLVVAIVREIFHDVLINSIKCQSFLRALSDGQHNEGIIRIARLLI